MDRLPTVRRLLKLRERFGDVRLEAACQRALTFEDARYLTVKRILETGQDLTVAAPSANPSVAARPLGFVRSAAELVGHLFGGVPWN
jgi:hypothetical protein